MPPLSFILGKSLSFDNFACNVVIIIVCLCSSVLNEANEANEDDDSSQKNKKNNKKKSNKRILCFGDDTKFKVEPFHLSNQGLELVSSGQLPLLHSTTHAQQSQSAAKGAVDEDEEQKEMLPLAEGRSVIVGGRIIEKVNCYLLAVTLPIISHKTIKPTDFLSIFPSYPTANRDPVARRFLVKLARNLLKIGKGKDRADTLSRMRDLQLLEHLKTMLSTAAFQSLATLIRHENNDDNRIDEEKEAEVMQQRQLEWQPSPQLAMELDALRLSLEAEDEAESSDDDL